jgi:hypothetical protein
VGEVIDFVYERIFLPPFMWLDRVFGSRIVAGSELCECGDDTVNGCAWEAVTPLWPVPRR